MQYITNHYKLHIILKNQKINLYILPYNSIDNIFSQIKNYVKDISPTTYEELQITIDDIIKTS